MAILEASPRKTWTVLVMVLSITLSSVLFQGAPIKGVEPRLTLQDARELDEGRQILARLIGMSVKGDSSPPSDRRYQSTFREDRRRSFDEELQKLAKWTDRSPQLVTEVLGDGFANNLAQMARDRHRNPDLYSRVESLYGVPKDLRTVAPRPMDLRAEDVKLRHVWEYFLIVPPTTSVDTMGTHPIKALGANRDPASLPVLVYRFKKECAESFGTSTVAHTSIPLFETILRFRSPAALDAAFECLNTMDRLAVIEQRPLDLIYHNQTEPNAEVIPVAIQNYRELMAHHLSARLPASSAQEWEAVLKKYPTSHLPVQDQRLVGDLLAEYQE